MATGLFDGYFKKNKAKKNSLVSDGYSHTDGMMDRFVQILTDLTDWSDKFNRFGQTSLPRV